MACGLVAVAVSSATAYSTATRLSPSAWATRTHYVMGTLLEIQAPVHAASGQQLFASLFDIARRHDEIFSTYKPDSPVSRFNRMACKNASMGAPPELIELTSAAIQIAEQTEGAFDITVGPLVQLWKQSAKQRRWPRSTEIAAARDHTGSAKLAINPRAATITALAEGIELDFGGIAKGYCVDKIVNRLRAAGVTQAFINFGESSVFALGKDPSGNPWKVSVRDPRNPDRAALELRLVDMSISTSASYENSLRIGSRVVNHIIDPRTGLPARIDLAVTVISKTATLADALSTALVVLPPAEGLKTLEKFPGTEAVIFYRSENGRWQKLLSPGMANFIEPDHKTHNERYQQL